VQLCTWKLAIDTSFCLFYLSDLSDVDLYIRNSERIALEIENLKRL
jgi:hypothetical protein